MTSAFFPFTLSYGVFPSRATSILFIMYTGGSVLPSPPPSSPVLFVELRYTPQFMFRVQSFYSLWDPVCRAMYRNIAIHRGETLFRNKVG